MEWWCGSSVRAPDLPHGSSVRAPDLITLIPEIKGCLNNRKLMRRMINEMRNIVF
jgi:hypothetical protein